jgi:hypothetical protein
MLLRMVALGALGYAGYKYYEKNVSGRPQSTEPDLSDPQVALAGGPLSSEAAVVHAGDDLPA